MGPVLKSNSHYCLITQYLNFAILKIDLFATQKRPLQSINFNSRNQMSEVNLISNLQKEEELTPADNRLLYKING